MWHLLQISGPLDRELGAALAEHTPLIGWEPERIGWRGRGREREAARINPYQKIQTTDDRFEVRKIPLLRGFARWPLSAFRQTYTTICQHLLAAAPDDPEQVLLVTSPFFAAVAERWRGPVVYWLSDLIARYGYTSFRQVAQLDRRLCRAATLVCPNSERIATYLRDHAHCPPEKITLLPNATRASNLLTTPSLGPAPLPNDVADLPRPIAGIIGNLATNMDWPFLEQLCRLKPELSWAMIGPTDMDIHDTPQREARRRVLALPQVRAVGVKLYGDLVHYARSFDVAVLPYRRVEPTFSGSSTRFYEHLAAGRPILATHGFEELLHKRPLLELFETPPQAAALITQLEATHFDDGQATARWLASQHGTWEQRASTLLDALARHRARLSTSLACNFTQSAAC